MPRRAWLHSEAFAVQKASIATTTIGLVRDDAFFGHSQVDISNSG